MTSQIKLKKQFKALKEEYKKQTEELNKACIERTKCNENQDLDGLKNAIRRISHIEEAMSHTHKQARSIATQIRAIK